MYAIWRFSILAMKNISISLTQLQWFLIVCVLRLLLDIGYFSLIVKQFDYYGFHDYHNSFSVVLSWLILIISFLFVDKILTIPDSRHSGLIVTVLYLLSFIPFTTCIAAGILPSGYIVLNSLYWLMLILFENISLSKPLKPFPTVKAGGFILDDKVAWGIGAFSLILIIFISGRYAHFRISFDLYSVYSIRSEARSYDFPLLISYLFSWTRAINPTMFAYSVLEKKRGMALLFFTAQMLSFGVDGLKSTFFMPFVFLLVILFVKRRNVTIIKKAIALGLTGIALLSVLEYFALGRFVILELIIRRVLFIPNYLSYCYYDFFQTHVPDYFRSSFLRFFGFSSPYTHNSQGITYIIGDVYFSKPSMNCNDGLIADALTNLGKPGLIIMPLLLISCLRLFDISTMKLDKGLSTTSALYLSYTLLSSFLLTVLLTHGMIVLTIILYFIGEKEAMYRGNT